MSVRNTARIAGMVMWMMFGVVATAGSHQEDKYPRKNISRMDLSNLNLDKYEFADTECVETNFTRASLKKANFKGANLNGANFYEAEMAEADFTGATAGTGYIQFIRANLNKTELPGVTIDLGIDCRLRGANLRKAKITSASLNCDFSGAHLEGANLRGSQLRQNSSSRLKGAFYDDDTSFPDGFDPKEAGMTLVTKEKGIKP